MKELQPLLKAKKRLLGASFGMAMGAMVLIGCDSVDGQGGDPDPVPNESCGGFGVLCDVSGVAGDASSFGDGGQAIAAKHYWPMDVTIGTTGELYIVDWNNHRVRKIDANGMMTSIIGAGTLGDDSSGPADQLDLNHPTGLTIGDDGHFYLASWHNWKIKLVDRNTNMTSIAVGTTQGFEGDGGPASNAKMDIPSSLVFDFEGNMYISDQGNYRIRKVETDGTITTFAGGGKGFADGIGTEAMFDAPQGPDATPGGKLTIDADRTTLYMADTFNNRIRKIDLATGEVTTIAGNGTGSYTGDGGPASAATLNGPTDVHLSHDNDLYIADAENHVIRKIDTNGIITTVAGTGQKGVSPDGTDAVSAMLNRPMGVAFDEANHTLYITDTFNHMVKRVYLGHDE